MTEKTLTELSETVMHFTNKSTKQPTIDIDNIKSYEEATLALDQIRARRQFEKTPEDKQKNKDDYYKAFTWGMKN